MIMILLILIVALVALIYSVKNKNWYQGEVKLVMLLRHQPLTMVFRESISFI